MMTARLSDQHGRAIRLWLYAVAALVLAMVLVGGATRLTESGLSITQWKPVTGVVPPLSLSDWQAEFAHYKEIPQFEKMKPGSRIVSHAADMKGVVPDKVITVKSQDDDQERKLYLWTVPLKKAEPSQ